MQELTLKPTLKLPVDALIFDMDGVLANTEDLHVKAWARALDGLDREAVFEKRGRMMGMSSAAIAVELIRQFGLEISADELLERKRREYYALVDQDLLPFDGLAAEIKRVSIMPLGLATSSSRADVDYLLTVLGLEGLFSPIVTADDVMSSKPAPDCYLLAARLLEMQPSACCVFEDSENGLHSALSAGTRVLAVSPLSLSKVPAGVVGVFPSTVEALQWLQS